MEEQYYRELLSYKTNHEIYEHQSKMNTLVQTEEYNLIAMLKPRIFIDGKQWCVLFGDNIQDSICGFGESPESAVFSFNNAWKHKLQRGER